MLRKKLSQFQSHADRTYNRAERVERENAALKNEVERLRAENRQLVRLKFSNSFPEQMAFNILDAERKQKAAEVERDMLRAQIAAGKIQIELSPAPPREPHAFSTPSAWLHLCEVCGRVKEDPAHAEGKGEG
jgi:hypothetical protein